VAFKEAVEQTPHLQDAWKSGLGALRRRDKPHVVAEDTRLLTGSAYVDKALETVEPHAHRWDYAIGYRHTNLQDEWLYWVEIHTASDGEIGVVLEKLRWLQDWLLRDGRRLNQFAREFVWISSGPTMFTRTSPQQRRFALLELQYKGRVFKIPKKRPE
jgi:hypothetical protein